MAAMEGDASAARAALDMVNHQLRPRGVRDEAVLAAMLAVPRFRFVPLAQRARAYDDAALPTADGQTISQPYIVALMTELLQVGRGMRVLDVGGGSGYQAAVLAEMGAQVVSIELKPRLADHARWLLSTLGAAVARAAAPPARRRGPHRHPAGHASGAAPGHLRPRRLALAPRHPHRRPLRPPSRPARVWRLGVTTDARRCDLMGKAGIRADAQVHAMMDRQSCDLCDAPVA